MKTKAKSLSTLIDEQCKKWEVEDQMAPDTSAQEMVVHTLEERKRSWITGLIAALGRMLPTVRKRWKMNMPDSPSSGCRSLPRK